MREFVTGNEKISPSLAEEDDEDDDDEESSPRESQSDHQRASISTLSESHVLYYIGCGQCWRRWEESSGTKQRKNENSDSET